MNSINKCPNCGNTKKGDSIYKCGNCGKIFCKKCGEERFGDVCSKCDKASQKIGEIKD